MKKLSLLEVKQALWDERFRNMFPEYDKDIKEFLNNPGCACNVELYRKLMSHKDKLAQYFPTREIVTPQEEIEELSRTRWKVINCHIDELETNLKKLGNKHKYIVAARWQDQITVIVSEPDFIF